MTPLQTKSSGGVALLYTRNIYLVGYMCSVNFDVEKLFFCVRLSNAVRLQSLT